MKPLMLRCQIVLSYSPDAHRARKFSAVRGTASQKSSICGTAHKSLIMDLEKACLEFA
jgi:hypothetical protein